MKDEDLKEIQNIVKRENDYVFRRVLGLAHKAIDKIEKQQKEIDDLKIFIKYMIKDASKE